MQGPSSYSVCCNDTEGTIIDSGKIFKSKLTYSISMLISPILDRIVNVQSHEKD